MLRTMIAVFVVVMSLPAAVAAAEPWRATAAAPREGLPDVEVTLGYDHQYVPAVNAPVVLRARSAERPFDGYIGYHIAIGERQTLEVPVIARAVLQPRSQWTFTTTTQLLMGMATWMESYFRERELVIEWRDRNMEKIGTRSVGAPPWAYPAKPLRVARANENPGTLVFGENAIVADASSLPGVPQWYGGFSRIVVPTPLWFELPRSTRDAIFRSAVPVVFVGIPDRMPAMQPSDRALLPIELRAEPAAVEIPWPYNDAARTIAAPVSWRAKSGSDVAGSPASPYLVTNAAAVFVADERALRNPLPSFDVRFRFHDWTGVQRTFPSPAEIFRDYRPAVFFVLLAALSIVAWLLLRRSPRVAVIVPILAVTLLALGWRNGIRPAADHHVFEQRTVVAPGVLHVTTIHYDAGPVPRSAPAADAAQAATERFIAATPREADDVEVRTSRTPQGFGDLYLPGRDWSAKWRATARRELAVTPAIRIRSQDATKLVIEYDSATPVDYVAATWAWKDRLNYGEARATSRRGVVTIRNGDPAGPGVRSLMFDYDELKRGVGLDRYPGVALMHVDRGRLVVQHSVPPLPASQTYRLGATLHRDERGGLSAVFALPGAMDGPVTALVASRMSKLRGNVIAVTISGPGGAARYAPNTKPPFDATVPAADMRRIAPAGGLIRVSAETSASVADIDSADCELRIGRSK